MSEARSILSDVLQSYTFWLFDVAPIDAISLPVLTPLLGFNSITAPEITIETQNIPEGNYFFTRKTIKRANVGNITLTRGSTFYDSDFWRWTRAALEGNTQLSSNASLGTGFGSAFKFQIGGPSPRRTLVLVHFFARNPLGTGVLGSVAGIGAVSALAGVIGATAAAPGQGFTQGAIAAGQIAAGSTIGRAGVGPFEFAARVPARCFVLGGCLPVRYKVGSNYDASSSAVSIAELELSVDVVEEVSLFA